MLTLRVVMVVTSNVVEAVRGDDLSNPIPLVFTMGRVRIVIAGGISAAPASPST